MLLQLLVIPSLAGTTLFMHQSTSQFLQISCIKTHIFDLEYPLFVFILHMLTVSEQSHLDFNVFWDSPGHHTFVWILNGWLPGVELKVETPP